MSDKKAQTRERILSAATSALLQRGPVGPSVGEVMSAAGLTVGGFYSHFESKDALMLEAFRELLAKRREGLKRFDPKLSFAERRASIAIPRRRVARFPVRSTRWPTSRKLSARPWKSTWN